MTEVNPAGWLQNAGATHTAAQLRTYMGSLTGIARTAGDLTRSRGGIHGSLGGQLVVSANGTPNMTVNVASGVAYIPGTESSSQGVYFCENDATVNLSIATAPGAGLSRIDLVVAKVIDQFYSGASNAWSLAVVTGTAAASPSAPSAPNNSLVLAQVTVGSLVSSITSGNIADTRTFAAALGGIVHCSSLSRPSAPAVGDVIFEADTNYFNVWNGTAWVWPGARGMIARATRATSSSGATGTAVGVLRLDNVPVVLGRAYTFNLSPVIIQSTVAGDLVEIDFRAVIGSTATVATAQYSAVVEDAKTGSAQQKVIGGAVDYIPASTGFLSLIITVVRSTGTGTVGINVVGGYPMRLWITDEGVAPADTGVVL